MPARAIWSGPGEFLPTSRKPKASVEGERSRPSGRLVVSAPIGFGRLHVSPVMSEYLKRYPEVSCDLRLTDRMINLVEDGVDLAVRIGHLADSSLVARHVGEMRRIVVASRPIPQSPWRAENARGDRIASNHPVRRDDRGAGLAFCQGWQRVSRRAGAALDHQQRRRRDPICRAGWRPDAGAGLSGGGCDQGRPAENRAGEVRAAGVPIHIVYPTSRLLSAKVRTFIDLVIEVSDWHFGERT